MHKLREKFCDELYEYEEQIKKNPKMKLSASEVGYIHMLTDTVKNIDKMKMLEEGGYSSATEFMGEGHMRGVSYAAHPMSYGYDNGQSRNYYREGGEGDSSYRDGSSYDRGYSERRRRDSMGRYSRADGKEHMMKSLEDAMHGAEDPKQREVLEKAMKDLERM